MKRGSSYLLLRVLVVGTFLVLSGRLWYMQVVQVDAYRSKAVESRIQTRIVPAQRGIIYDRNGVPFVRNSPRLTVTVTPESWPASRAVQESRLLSRLLHHHPTASKVRWLVNADQYPTRPVTIKDFITLKTFYILRSYANQLPGVYASEDLSHRNYLGTAPYPLAHILGYVGAINSNQWRQDSGRRWASQRYTANDIVGQAGVEEQFEHILHGTNGIQGSQIDAQLNQVSPWKTIKSAVPGDGIRLTISGHFENQVAQVLEASIKKMQTECCPIGLPKQAAAVVMNPSNGQILAMVSLPSYNPNVYTSAQSRWRNRQLKAITKGNDLFDITTGAALPPGSIYKIITATAGLESGVITPSTIVDDTGDLQRYPGARTFYGWQPPPGLGPLDIVHAIARSSDIFFYEAAGGGPNIPGNGIGPYRLGHWARMYGLGKPTGIQLPYENGGLVPSPKEVRKLHHRPWSYGDSYNMGIGQGDTLVTPLQMVRVVSVIANGGNLVRPTIIDAVTGPNGKHVLPGKNYGATPHIVRRHFVAKWVTSMIGDGMHLGVTWGYPGDPLGTSYGQVDIRTNGAGKTGTAQTPPWATAWWLGFAPYNHPRIAVCVVVPQARAEGAYAAAPIASKIMMDYLHKPDPNWLNLVTKRLLALN